MADYVIQHGDNLSRIARTHCTDVKTLMKLNPQIKNQNLIFANDTIKLPEAKVDTFTREVPQEQQGNEPTAHIPQEKAQENPATLPHGEATPATTAEEIQTPQQETQQQASLTGNPFLYATGGAAAGVIGMRLVEKTAPYVKKGAVVAAQKTKTAAKATAAATKSAAKATGKAAAKGGKAALAATGKAAPTIMKAAGKVAKPLAVAYAAVEIADAYEKGGTKAAVKKGATTASAVGGAWAGAKLGAMAGAAIGSAVPVVGTAAGALVGGIIGSIGGWFAGEKTAEAVLS